MILWLVVPLTLISPHPFLLNPTSQRPHSTLPREHYQALSDHLREHGFDVGENLHILSSEQSHTIPGVMMVLNDSTDDFNRIASVFDQVSFQHALHSLGSTPNSSRGNKQGNFGFAVQNILADGCSVSHVSKPGVLQNTDLHGEIFDGMSTLDDALLHTAHPPESNDRLDFRRVAFAGQITPNNKFEFLAPTAYDKDSPHCVCHLDESNDPELGTVLLASGVFADTLSNPPRLIRLLNIATYRKSVSDFLLRVERAATLVDDVKRFYSQLHTWERGFNPSTFFQKSVGQSFVVAGTWLASKANSDRCIAVSAYVAIILYFIETYQPTTLEELLEVVLVCFYMTEPIKFRIMVQE